MLRHQGGQLYAEEQYDTYHSFAHLEQMRRPMRQSTDRMFGDKHS